MREGKYKKIMAVELVVVMVSMVTVSCGGLGGASTPGPVAPAPAWSRTFGSWPTTYEPYVEAKEGVGGGLMVAATSRETRESKEHVWAASLSATGGIRWELALGGEGEEILRDFSPTSDGGVVLLAGTSSLGQGLFDIWVVKLDSTGTQVFSRVFGGEEHEGTTDIFQTPDGGFAALGMTLSMGAGSVDMWLLRMDPNGDDLWDKIIGGVVMDLSNALLQAPDGGFLVGGMEGASIFSTFDARVFRLDPGGNVVWDLTLDRSDTDRCRSLHLGGNGGFVVVGRSEIFHSSTSVYWLAGIGDDGAVAWERDIDLGQGVEVKAVAEGTDGGFFAVGTRDVPETGQAALVAAKLDSLGQILWTTAPSGAVDDESVALAPMPDGGVGLGASTPDAGLGSPIRILRLDPSGEILWQREFSNLDCNGLQSLLSMADGGLTATAWTWGSDAEYKSLWLLRLDDDGEL